jgi:ABC-type transport system involved in Fe-S cluster assembly, permease component
MEQLQNIKNYIILHNGKIITKSISENIEVSESIITVKQATNLQISYIVDRDDIYNMELHVETPTLDLIETFNCQSEAKYHRSTFINPNSNVTRYVNIDSMMPAKLQVKDTVEVKKNGHIKCAYVDFSNALTNGDFQYDLAGEYAQAKIRIGVLSKKEENKEYKIHLRHLAPYTMGHMDNYGVVKDTAKLIIDGIGTIPQGNYQSDNHQVNKILVFNKDCQAKANPYLYIDEYDVKASHGASVGKVDDEQLYYLQSRGLPKDQALHLITYGYFIPVLEFITNEQLQEQYNELLKEKVGI